MAFQPEAARVDDLAAFDHSGTGADAPLCAANVSCSAFTARADIVEGVVAQVVTPLSLSSRATCLYPSLHHPRAYTHTPLFTRHVLSPLDPPRAHTPLFTAKFFTPLWHLLM